jgi:hypothetical protein
MIKQNVLRAICESYISLLEYEGRLHTDFECLLCEIPIDDDVCIVRGFLPIHSKCTKAKAFNNKKIKELFQSKKTITLNDEEIEDLWDVILQGL